MPRMNNDIMELTPSELFDLEADLAKLKQIEGWNRKKTTTIDKCILLVQMYQQMKAKYEEHMDRCTDIPRAKEVDTLSIVSAMGSIYELATQARDNSYYSDDMIRRIIDISLKYRD